MQNGRQPAHLPCKSWAHNLQAEVCQSVKCNRCLTHLLCKLWAHDLQGMGTPSPGHARWQSSHACHVSCKHALHMTEACTARQAAAPLPLHCEIKFQRGREAAAVGSGASIGRSLQNWRNLWAHLGAWQPYCGELLAARAENIDLIKSGSVYSNFKGCIPSQHSLVSAGYESTLTNTPLSYIWIMLPHKYRRGWPRWLGSWSIFCMRKEMTNGGHVEV